MIELVDVTKSYNGTVKAVDRLTLTVPRGKSSVFSGQTGRARQRRSR